MLQTLILVAYPNKLNKLICRTMFVDHDGFCLSRLPPASVIPLQRPYVPSDGWILDKIFQLQATCVVAAAGEIPGDLLVRVIFKLNLDRR